LAAASDNTICGGTTFPMRFFSYNPAGDRWVNHKAHGQWNTVAATDSVFYAGGYGGGFLLEWDPAKPWVDTKKGDPKSNPLFLHEAKPTINRPHDLLVYPDGRHVILAGTPGYGLTGGGLMIWDRMTRKAEILKHTDLIQWQSTKSLVALADGRLLGGTTIAAGTGGEAKATEAELYILDLKTRKVLWHKPMLKGARNYTDMMMGPDGQIFGFADQTRFFVFDPVQHTIVHSATLSEELARTVSSQGARVFVKSPDGRIFIILSHGIAQLDPQSRKITLLTKTPGGVTAGGDWLNGRIYFALGSHVYSWRPAAAKR
jgi:hypothetical protein